MADPLERAWTPDEFFAWQQRQPHRYELVSGQPLKMMSGASNVHDDIVVNILAELRNQLRGSGCRPFTADGAVETYPGQIRRPDVGVDCERRDPKSFKASGPRLVVEVLSPSTRDFDALRKLEEYKNVPGLEYILYVEPNEPLVWLSSRDDDKVWREARHDGLDGAVELPKLGVSLSLRAIYDGVEFPPAPPRIAGDLPR